MVATLNSLNLFCLILCVADAHWALILNCTRLISYCFSLEIDDRVSLSIKLNTNKKFTLRAHEIKVANPDNLNFLKPLAMSM
jgi:hypothetical protein